MTDYICNNNKSQGGENVKERIRQSGLKQWQIAEAIGVSEWTLAR